VTLSSASNIVVAHAGGTSTAAITGLTAATTNTATTTGFVGLSVGTVSGANLAIQSMDAALTAVNDARASLGAVQNRFESTIANLSTTAENLSAARSRIQDADFAAETASMTRAQILQQAGTAMVAQANSLPQSVLSLLR
jgi:flagellin